MVGHKRAQLQADEQNNPGQDTREKTRQNGEHSEENRIKAALKGTFLPCPYEIVGQAEILYRQNDAERARKGKTVEITPSFPH